MDQSTSKPSDADWNEIKNREHQEVLTLYNGCAEDIALFKKHQWMVAHFGFLLYVALVTVWSQVWPFKFSETLNTIGYFTIITLGCFIFDRSYSFICRLSSSIIVRKSRLFSIRTEYFSDNFRTYWKKGEGETPKNIENEKKSVKRIEHYFCCALFTGLCVVIAITTILFFKQQATHMEWGNKFIKDIFYLIFVLLLGIIFGYLFRNKKYLF